MYEFCYLGVFLFILSIILILMLQNRIILKMAVRNMLRRKVNTIIVVLGLMVGTAIISSALVIGDTMDSMIESAVLDGYYTTDEIIIGRNLIGEPDYFNETVYDEVVDGFNSSRYIDGISKHIMDIVSVMDLTSKSYEPTVNFYGIDFEHGENFGAFISKDGGRIKGLSNTEIMIGESTAKKLNAKAGDSITVFAFNRSWNFTLTYVLEKEERASSGVGIFVSIEMAQVMLNKTGEINQILISNKGGVYEGMKYTDEVKEEFESIKFSDKSHSYKIEYIKKEDLENYREGIKAFTNLFLVFGTFSIIAGVILIINIFVMLGEERKSEMGMARAIGMKRSHLRRMYLFEGTFYSLIASLIGVLFGIVVGYLVIYAFGEIVRSAGEEEFDILQYFTFTGASMVIGFISGFFITIITIYLASGRISKINIVRAIRDIPEPEIPRSDRRMMLIGIATFISGFLLLIAGSYSELTAPFISGLSLMVFGACIFMRRFTGDRVAFSVAGFGILFIWAIDSFVKVYPDYKGDLELFILSGLFLVSASLMIVMFNSELIIKALTYIVGKGKATQAVVKTAVSYSLYSKFRTGMTMAMFALVIFTITTMSMIVGMFGTNIERQVQDASGGYEIYAYCKKHSPIYDIKSQISNTTLEPKIDRLSAPLTGDVLIGNQTDFFGRPLTYRIIGVDDDFIDQNRFKFSKLLPEYKDAKEAWKAIKDNSSLIIVDASVLGFEYGPPVGFFTTDVGKEVELKDRHGNITEKRVIGIIDTIYIQGIFSYDEYVRDEFNITTSTLFLFSVAKGYDADDVADEIEEMFIMNGMDAVVLETMIREGIKSMNQFFDLFNAFLGLGLIVGIAGLGIITMRSVHERRQEIGMMRALGFKRKMVLATFLLETSVISILGILIGTLLGIFVGYIIWEDGLDEEGFEFYINWEPIVTVFIIAFVATLLCTIPASLKASKVAPAEALRYE